MKVYRCYVCKLAWFEDQVVNAFDGKAFCRQDGSPLRDISKTKKAQRLIEARNRAEEMLKEKR